MLVAALFIQHLWRERERGSRLVTCKHENSGFIDEDRLRLRFIPEGTCARPKPIVLFIV